MTQISTDLIILNKYLTRSASRSDQLKQDLTRSASRSDQWKIGAWISYKGLNTKEYQMCWKLFPTGVAIFVSRKNAPLAEKTCSSSLNGSDLEQMSYNRDGRLPLEVVEIWNEFLW